ncbi:MAG: hypothetical protein JST73_07975 [Actinobacteria bacterium]|nr:hypothetical protein [Actinomycetota bacterium]
MELVHPMAVTGHLRTAAIAAVMLATAFALGGCRGNSESVVRSPTTVAPTTSTAPRSVVHDFVIPAGTADRVARGEDPKIIPRRIDLHVGDSIRVRNDDTKIARFGLFNVGPGDTVSMTFNEVGVKSGVIFGDAGGGCGTSPAEDKIFVVNVRS